MLRRSSFVLPMLLLAACSSSTTTNAPADGDAGSPGSDARATGDAATTGETSTDAGCGTDCMTTMLTATFAGMSQPLTRAQFGYVVSDSGPDKLHIEAHAGGSPACPTMSSPQTDRTLVMEDVPEPSGTTPLTKANGITAALFDFKGDLLTMSTYATANTITLTPVASSFVSRADAYVAFDVDMTFPQGGTLHGRLYATHCDSMD
ncbi:MAG: hypothetical protein ABIP39_11415 [Polyangiaceae bacterium]